MNIVNHAMLHGVGLGQLDRLSQIPTDRMPSRPEQDLAPRNPHRISAYEVRLSDWARSFVVTPLIYLPPSDRPGGDSDLASSIRKVGEFLKEYPKIVKSSFGKSVHSQMLGAVHLVKGGSSLRAPRANGSRC